MITWWRGRSERGAFAVELAVLAPVVLALFVVIYEAGQVVRAQSQVQSAARDIARLITSEPNGVSLTPALPAEVAGYDCDPVQPVETPTVGDWPPTQTVRVVLNCQVHLMGGVTKTITAQAVQRTDPYRSTVGQQP